MMTLDHETLKGVMERPPRKMSDRLLDRSLILKAFFWYGMLESLLAMIGFFVTYWTSQGHLNHLAVSGSLYKEATTMTLGAIIFAQMGMVMIARSDGHSIRHLPIFANKLITSGILLEIGLFIALAYTPFLQKIFNTAPISFIDWLYLLLCPFLMVGMEEIRLAFKRGRKA
ncbi:cation transporting ATPase C-terminal domain-containing protein [Streptococcus uberis]|uniref:cation transporting ATPase C-terminal domain-containing protein n=1 Tax=Streptococcus uberis TaxID=1349 RepID=UPI003D76FBA2